MANLLTCIRIICSMVLLFSHPFSECFYVVYLLAGFTDMVDGTVARKMGTSSEFGAKLDTIADTVLALACLIKLLPVLNIEAWMYAWILIIAVIKVINILSGIFLEKKLVTVHSAANRITGVLLFVLPLLLGWIELKYSAAIVCAAATFAAVQEGHYIRTGRGSNMSDVISKLNDKNDKAAYEYARVPGIESSKSDKYLPSIPKLTERK